MEEKQIILIGGAPTGKSTIALALSKALGLPSISTDQIRTILRSVASKDKYPALFNSSDYDAERFLTELTTEQIVTMEFEQGEETWLGVRALINDCDYEWKDGCIIEGVGILPNMVAADFKDDTRVTALFLVDHDISRMREAIFKRGLWDEAHKYSDHLKEKEVEWAFLYGKRLEEEAKKYDYPWVEVHKNQDDLARIMALINNKQLA
jgi:2-phosphoglycerate kinase